jgi:hypothetical protein
MDWTKAIERNSEALKAIVAALFAMLEQAGGAAAARLPRPLYRAVLSVLRPAESAVRRLIVIAARGLVVKPAPSRPKPAPPRPMPARPIGQGGRNRLSFQLFDPRKRFAPQRLRRGPRAVPRIHIFGRDPHLVPLWLSRAPSAAPAAPPDDGLIDARRLSLRLEAVKLALENLPRQARRLARLRARREKVPELRLKSPLRPGRPPGHRKRPVHDVDRVLAECHRLACYAMMPDTS